MIHVQNSREHLAAKLHHKLRAAVFGPLLEVVTMEVVLFPVLRRAKRTLGVKGARGPRVQGKFYLLRVSIVITVA